MHRELSLQRQRSPAPLPAILRPCDLTVYRCLQVDALRVAHAAGRYGTHRRGQGLLGLRPVISNDVTAWRIASSAVGNRPAASSVCTHCAASGVSSTFTYSPPLGYNHSIERRHCEWGHHTICSKSYAKPDWTGAERRSSTRLVD